MASRQIVVDIIGDSTKWNAATRSAMTDADRLGVSLSTLSKGGLVAGAGAKVASVGVDLMSSAAGRAVDFLGDLVKSGMDEEESISTMTTALRANIPAWDGNTSAIERVMKARVALGFSDDEQRASLALIVPVTRDAAKALDLERTAMDLARLKKISLADATQALTNIEGGRYRGLAQLIGSTKDITSADEAMAAVERVAQGQAEEYAATTSGKLLVAQTKFGEEMDRFGSAILPAVSSYLDFINGGLDQFASGMDRAGDSGEGLISRSQGLVDVMGMLNPLAWGNTAAAWGLSAAHEDAARSAAVEAAAMAELEAARVGARAGLEGLTRSQVSAQRAANRLADGIVAAGSGAATAAPKVQTLADAVRGAVSPTQDLDDALDRFFGSIISNAYAPRQLRDDIKTLTGEIARERDRIAELNGMHHRTPQQKEELDGLNSQLLDNSQRLDETVVKLGTLDGASVADITAAMKTLRKDGIDPASAGLGALDDRIAATISHARTLARALSGTGGPGGPAPIDGRASGGPAAGLTWVGEDGPELLSLPLGSYVHSNAESMGMASGSPSAQGGRTAPGVVNITINGAQSVSALMLELKRELARQGMTFS